MSHVEIYTDGAARGNPNGPGGYGAILRFTDSKGQVHEKELSEGFNPTSNNRMELLAAIRALQRGQQGVAFLLAEKRLEDRRQVPRQEPRPLGAVPSGKGPAPGHLSLGQGPCRPPGERAMRYACHNRSRRHERDKEAQPG